MGAGWEVGGGGKFPAGSGAVPPLRTLLEVPASILPPGRQRPASGCSFRDAEVRQSRGTFQAGMRGLYLVFRQLFFPGKDGF